MAVDHYENFPVASLLLPRHLHAPVAAIYRFARSADDIADEGNAPPEERLAQLKDYDAALMAIAEQRPLPEHLAPIFTPLAVEHQRIGLPLAPCHALLSAFMQDVHQTRYATYAELADYCKRSANPVGQLMLFLFDALTPENLAMSDSICTALQLTNHWQDIAIDATKGAAGRIYLPQDELMLWGYTDADILSGNAVTRDSARWAEFMAFQTQRVSALFDQAQALPAQLGRHSWRIWQELQLTVAGGRRILQKIDVVAGDVYSHRPKLNGLDWLRILLRR
ncbi:MAG: Squalene synthase [Fluviibacter phosphoraccumulans EoVTN8]